MNSREKNSIRAISVLIPTFNGMPYLPQTVESALKQTYSNIEVLIINDGSTDDTEDYLKTIRDKRVRVIHKRNEGLVATLNLGLNLVSHEWVARIDADDSMAPERLEKQAAFLSENPQYSVVASNYGFIDKENRILKIKKKLALKNPPDFDPRIDPNIPHQGVLYNKHHVLEADGYRELVPAEDLDLWLRMAKKYKLAAIPEVLTFVRVLDSGISLSNFTKQRIMWRYVLECARQRDAGLPEMPYNIWIEGKKEWIARNKRQWESERNLRVAGFELANRQPVKAGIHGLKAFWYNPQTFLKKIISYKTF